MLAQQPIIELNWLANKYSSLTRSVTYYLQHKKSCIARYVHTHSRVLLVFGRRVYISGNALFPVLQLLRVSSINTIV